MKKKIALSTLAIIPMTASNIYAGGDNNGMVTATSLNVRSGPSTSKSVLFTVKKNETVKILESSGGWYKISSQSGKQGWASSSYIKKIENSNSTNKKEVTATSLNMRSGPSTNYRVLMSIKKGQQVEFISLNGEWAKIKYNGVIGYAHNDYLKDISIDNDNSTNHESMVVNATSLNVRSGPNTSYQIVGKLIKGSEVKVISESNGWSKIKYNNKDAYVSSRYLVKETQTPDENEKPEIPDVVYSEKVVNTSNLNVRSGPSTSYTKVGQLQKGEKVKVISESGGWSKINYKTKEAYVATKYLDNSSTQKPQDPPPTVSPTQEKYVNVASLNVRSGPSTNYSILGSISKGNKVNVISEANGWSKIKFNNKDAFVSSQYLTDKLDVETPPETEKPDNNGSSDNEDKVVNGANIRYNKLNYSLINHIDAQMERVSIGGNVIDSSKPRSAEILTAMSRGFVPADRSDIEYFVNPNNFTNSNKGMMQFMRIDEYRSGITASELNGYLNGLVPASSGTNVFYNQGQAFISAAQKYDIDVVYLVAHAMWETAYGRSTLAQGQTITSYKGQPLDGPVTVYNFFGIGAIDHSANVSGAEAAYSNGWTSIEATIDGSAKWISSNYINSSKYNQNTIYKMKFNYNQTWHQYATDVNWANGISNIMLKIIPMYGTGQGLDFEVPVH